LKGKPDLFITMTADPFFPEMMEDPNIRRNDNTLNPDVVNRIFLEKIKHLRKLIIKDMVLGKVTNVISVTEFQKRGLPHIHMIVTLMDKVREVMCLYFGHISLIKFQIVNPCDVDSYMTCEVPDKTEHPELFRLATKLMVHQKCNYRCVRRGKCSKGYPFPFLEQTILDDGHGFIQPRRPRGGARFKLNRIDYDVRDMVPTNWPLLRALGVHVCVQGFKDYRQLSYLLKYLTKGPDMAKCDLVYKMFGYKIKVNNVESF
jgi:hypothetical protein